MFEYKFALLLTSRVLFDLHSQILTPTYISLLVKGGRGVNLKLIAYEKQLTLLLLQFYCH